MQLGLARIPVLFAMNDYILCKRSMHDRELPLSGRLCSSPLERFLASESRWWKLSRDAAGVTSQEHEWRSTHFLRRPSWWRQHVSECYWRISLPIIETTLCKMCTDARLGEPVRVAAMMWCAQASSSAILFPVSCSWSCPRRRCGNARGTHRWGTSPEPWLRPCFSAIHVHVRVR